MITIELIDEAATQKTMAHYMNFLSVNIAIILVLVLVLIIGERAYKRLGAIL